VHLIYYNATDEMIKILEMHDKIHIQKYMQNSIKVIYPIELFYSKTDPSESSGSKIIATFILRNTYN